MRPSSVQVQFDRETEIRFDYGVSESPGSVVLQNVLPISVENQGGCVMLAPDDLLKAWGKAWDLPPARPLPPVRVGPSSLGYWTALALWALVGLALVLACAGCSTPSNYRTADRSRFEVIAPEYDRYVDADPKLDAEQRERRHRLTRAWDADSAGLDERPTTNGAGK